MMKFNRSLIVLAVAAIGSFGAPVAMAQSAGGPALAARSSDAGGVRVVVKPKSTGTGSAWEFEVTMDTHTKPLNDDLMKTSALVDDSKRRYTPLAWQGDPPGGHHRKGILRFPAPDKQTGSFEVQIEGFGGASKRVFQWSAN